MEGGIMKLFGSSVESKRMVTDSLGSRVVSLYVVALLAQVVAIYSTANANRAQGLAVSPKQEVVDFLSVVALFAIGAVALVLTVKVALYVMRISPSGDSDRAQRVIAWICFKAAGIAIIATVAYFTRGFWQSVVLQSMVALPLFYVVIGVWLWFRYVRVKKVRAPREPKPKRSASSTSSAPSSASTLDEMMSNPA